MTAVGRARCTCGQVEWKGTGPGNAPRRVVGFDPAQGDADEEMAITWLHYFDGRRCEIESTKVVLRAEAVVLPERKSRGRKR